MSDTPQIGQSRPGVIHDLGYRHFDGVRDGTPTIARTLFVTGLRHAYGLGRSGKSAEDMTDRAARGLDATTHTAAGSGGAPQMTGTGTTTATGGGGAPPHKRK